VVYSRTGINYPPKHEIVRAFGRYFGQAEFIEREFVVATREVSRLSGLIAPVISWPCVEALYRDFHTRVVLARKLQIKLPRFHLRCVVVAVAGGPTAKVLGWCRPTGASSWYAWLPRVI